MRAFSFQIELTQNAASVVRRIENFPFAMGSAIARALDQENQLTVGHIIETKLTAAGPKFLNVDSGRLRKSVRATAADVQGNTITSAIGTNVKYAGAHEYGFSGVVAVQAFTRRSPQADRFDLAGKILSRKLATGLGLFDKNGRLRRRAKLAQHSSGLSRVKAHKRKVNIRERKMFRTGIAERLPAYRVSLSAAIVRSWAEGERP